MTSLLTFVKSRPLTCSLSRFVKDLSLTKMKKSRNAPSAAENERSADERSVRERRLFLIRKI